MRIGGEAVLCIIGRCCLCLVGEEGEDTLGGCVCEMDNFEEIYL